ncbi:hypothetical protein PENPOL_c015G04931 [Penicillium polonicum]|uniref:Uncharacterized protein n=1 Tax=Penicillium polonicum TaxID=60169 RepID=A0A1V6NAU5_PENPO|nr:hypothetical protein PENPOL_c015G04931 [Penicillium polonicum]
MEGFLSRLESATRWFPVSMPLAERKLVRKLDWLVLPYACLIFVKYLDVSALTNALQEEGFKPSTGLNKTIIKRIFTSWQFYTFVLLLVIFCNMTYSEATPFILWLDSQPDKYPVALVNNLSTVTNGAAVAGALVMSFHSDIRGSLT